MLQHAAVEQFLSLAKYRVEDPANMTLFVTTILPHFQVNTLGNVFPSIHPNLPLLVTFWHLTWPSSWLLLTVVAAVLPTIFIASTLKFVESGRKWDQGSDIAGVGEKRKKVLF